MPTRPRALADPPAGRPAAPAADGPATDGRLDTSALSIDGMHCAACASRIQRALAARPGVVSASVNLATDRAFVTYDAGATDPDALCAAVDALGYRATVEAAEQPRAAVTDPEHWAARVAASWPLALAALGVALLAPEDATAGWLVLVLAVAVEVVGGWPFLRTTVRLARHGATNMDTLITLGTLAALAVIAVETIALGGRHVHLGGSGAFAARLHGVMAPLIVCVVATGRMVEARARRRAAAAMHYLLGLRPPVARLVAHAEDEEGELVPPESVPVGALVRVRPGEVVPLDGVVVAGWSPIDESMLTGEPLPVDRGPGSAVTGGTRNGAGALAVRVTAAAADSVLAGMQRLVEEAQQDKPPLQRLADRISAVFVPAVLAIAVASFLLWWRLDGNFGVAVLAAVAVLLVACPCAMGLATPVAMMVGTGRASALGILIRRADALDRLARADTAVFDKTGTLTEPEAEVTGVVPVPGVTADEVVAWAAAVEAESDHPIAAALRRAAMGGSGSGGDGCEPDAVRATDVAVTTGSGVAGTVAGHHVAVGRMDGDAPPGVAAGAVAEFAARGDTVVAVTRDDQLVGVVGVATRVRSEAPAAIDRLHRMGVDTAILSGDAAPAVTAVAGTVGIASSRAGLRPNDKLDAIRAAQAAGHHVIMVGDGVNDAPALAAADVGVAVGGGTEAALANSDVTLLGSDLHGVPAAVAAARAISAVVVQNFGWAMGYNLAALPLAAAGLLDPLVAALAMGVSSLAVVLNSLRLLRLGRGGLDRVSPPRVLRGTRGFAVSVAVPVLLFAGATVVGQAVSPSRGQPLLPTLPSITTVAVTPRAAAEVYLQTLQAGVNEFHLVFTPAGSASALPAVHHPQAVATRVGGPVVPLRLVRYSPDHFVAYTVLGAGQWRFRVVAAVDGRLRTFTVARLLS